MGSRTYHYRIQLLAARHAKHCRSDGRCLRRPVRTFRLPWCIARQRMGSEYRRVGRYRRGLRQRRVSLVLVLGVVFAGAAVAEASSPYLDLDLDRGLNQDLGLSHSRLDHWMRRSMHLVRMLDVEVREEVLMIRALSRKSRKSRL